MHHSSFLGEAVELVNVKHAPVSTLVLPDTSQPSHDSTPAWDDGEEGEGDAKKNGSRVNAVLDTKQIIPSQIQSKEGQLVLPGTPMAS